MKRFRAILALGTLAAIAAGLALAWTLATSDPFRLAESAAAKGQWAEALKQSDLHLQRKPADVRARALRARSLAGLGRSSESRTGFLSLGAENMQPADFLALSELLAKDGRFALATLAIEVATRIAPDDPAVKSARTALHARVGRDGGIAHVVDHLMTIPGGPALGEVVVALAAHAKGDSSDDPLIDRFLLRDRPGLRAASPADAARRLVARTLLEVGRPDEAVAELTNDPSPEAAWLLSRVALQRRQIAEASVALTKSGSYGLDRTHEPDPALYVGAVACRKCHPKQYAAEQSSRHATTLQHGPDLAKITLPDGPITDPVDPKVVHRFTREGEKVRIETKVGDKTYSALMDYALGSGNRGATLIGKSSDGAYREARISQYSEHGLMWDVTSGFSPAPSDPAEYLGKVLAPSGFRDCLHCHTTRFRSIDDRNGPEARDRGIGCERCHGPGGNHVRAVEGKLPDLAIAKYTDATGPQRMAVCSSCHGSDGTFPPTDSQFIRFQSSTLPFSKCYTESKGKLDCVTCHDPHKLLETAPRFYESRCLDCHGNKMDAISDDFKRVSCPVNATSDCLKCHMPNVPEVVPHTSFTDHHIRVHREEKVR